MYAFLSAVDGDTIKCNGKNMRIIGPGAPNESGVDTPEIFSPECPQEELLGEQAKLRLEELLRQDMRGDRWDRPLLWVRMPNGETAGEVLLRRVCSNLAAGKSIHGASEGITEELTRLLTVYGAVDQAEGRRLILRATSKLSDQKRQLRSLPDLEQASALLSPVEFEERAILSQPRVQKTGSRPQCWIPSC